MADSNTYEVTRGEINDIIGKFSTENPEYRNAVKANPKAVLAKQMGQELPEWLNVSVVEETGDTIYLVLPHVAGEELSDADLESVAGGKSSGGNKYECNNVKGVGTHIEINASFSI